MTESTQTLWFGETHAPVVVLAHDWNGRLPWIERFAKRLAAAGYRVAVPDFYHGKTALDDEGAEALLQEVVADTGPAQHLISAAIGEARALGSEKSAVVGFSMGVFVGLDYAAQGSIDAFVGYYGVPSSQELMVRVPILFQLADEDSFDGREVQEGFREQLAAEGFRDVTINSYGGVHGFQNEQIPYRYSNTASEEAWPLTLAFLDEHLKNQ